MRRGGTRAASKAARGVKNDRCQQQMVVIGVFVPSLIGSISMCIPGDGGRVRLIHRDRHTPSGRWHIFLHIASYAVRRAPCIWLGGRGMIGMRMRSGGRGSLLLLLTARILGRSQRRRPPCRRRDWPCLGRLPLSRSLMGPPSSSGFVYRRFFLKILNSSAKYLRCSTDTVRKSTHSHSTHQKQP